MDIFTYAKNNDLKGLKENLKYVNINIIDESGNSILNYAVINNNVEMVHYLILNHINLNLTDSNLNTALMLAVNYNSMGCFRALIRKGADINLKNKQGESALAIATKLARREMIEILISRDVEIDFTNSLGENILFLALNTNNLEMIESLINKNPTLLYSKNNIEDTLLHQAVKRSNIKAAKYLLDKGLLPNSLNIEGETPLFYAARNADTLVSSLLIERGAFIEFKNRFEESILDVSNARTKEFLIFKQNETKYQNYIRKYPLNYYVIINDLELFLNNINKIEIKKKDDLGHDCMYYAKMYNRLSFIEILNKYNNSVKNTRYKIIN